MPRNQTIKAVALAVALASGGSVAFAASSSAPSTAAVRDMTQMTTQGNKAYANVLEARLALFNGQPELATKLVRSSETALQKASKDNTAFIAAESELQMAPAGAGQAAPASKDTAAVAWLPVDASMTLMEDFSASPTKKAAVAAANDHLKKGDHAAAIKALKLADVNVSYSTALLPLKQTMADVQAADGLLTANKFYEANQTLRKVEQSVRVVVLDDNLVPKRSAAQ